jgi:membrane-bound ClpP family serine protease
MKNQEVWNYAQSIYPVLLMKGGMSLVFLGIVMWLLDSSQPAVAIVGTAGMFIVIIVLFVNVEKKLKQFERSQESNSNS